MDGHHGLGTLQVRVPRQDHVEVAIAAGDEGPLQVFEQGVDVLRRGPDEKLEIGRNLVVAAAGRVQLASHVADPRDQRALDVHVDVFQLDAKGEFPFVDLAADRRRAW